MVRRCNYKPKLIKQARQALIDSIDEYNPNNVLNKRYEYTKMVDITYLDIITNTANELRQELKDKLIHIFDMVLSHEPFDVICIHDSFNITNRHTSIKYNILYCITCFIFLLNPLDFSWG